LGRASGGDPRHGRLGQPVAVWRQWVGAPARTELPRRLSVHGALRAGHRADDLRPDLLHLMRNEPPRAFLRLAAGLPRLGTRRGLWRLQLQRTLQLADLRVRPEAKRVPIALAGT